MKQKEHWGSKLGFIMAIAGSAIGLGSLWKFPYVTGVNGGGVFVLFYLLFTFFLAIPIFIAELIIGRSTGRSPVTAFSELSNKSRNWKIVGWLGVITSFFVFSYYNVVAGWTLNYTVMSLCNFSQGRSADEIRQVFDVMYTSADVNIFWCFSFMLLTAGIVYCGVRKGIEYWTKLLTPALFILLIVLFIYSMTLDGFGEAVRFIFYPDFSNLRPSGILEALGLAFFTLSVGMGIIVTYGSYMRPEDDVPKTAFIVGGITTGISLIAGLMIFPIIFTFGLEPQEGMGLLFKTLPVLFAKLPGTVIISTTFFVLLIFTTLTSTVSLLEAMVASLMELMDISRRKATLLAASATFIFGIPSALSGPGTIFGSWKAMYGTDFFGTMSTLTDHWMLPVSGLLVALFTGWFVDKKLLEKEFKDNSTFKALFGIWFGLIRWIVPIAIFVVLLHTSGIVDFDKLWGFTVTK